jgi:hypothetical protein
MAPRSGQLLGEIGSSLGELPDVFSTAQWGGRAYKVPGPGGSRNRPKLLAFVCLTRDEKAVSVSFKLPKDRAAAAVDRHAWIEPHDFGSLARSGWVAARLTTRRQWQSLRPLIQASRQLYPRTEPEPETEAESRRPARQGSDSSRSHEARRIDRVMREAADAGWSPGEDF